MAVTPTIYAKSIVWNSLTWDASTAGGPVGFRYLHEGQEVETLTGDDEYSRTTFVGNKACRIFVSLVDVKQTLSPGTMSDMTVTLSTKAGTQTITYPDAVFLGLNGNQPRADLGEVELSFILEASDGQTNPVDASIS